MPFKIDATDKIPAQNQVIWRYMDLAKFIDLIRSGEMWFNCVNEFAEKDDRFESAFPTSQVEGLREDLIKLNEQPTRRSFGDDLGKQINDLGASVMSSITTGWIKAAQKSVYVSCWHMNDYESAAMWSQYVRTADGIAIKTTLKNLIDSMAAEARSVRISRIEYIDYDKDRIHWSRAYLYKRMSFEHEKELRAFACDDELNKKLQLESGYFQFPDLLDPVKHKTYVPGVKIKIDPAKVIGEVRIAPTAQGFLSNALRDVMDKYGLKDKRIFQSSMKDLPK